MATDGKIAKRLIWAREYHGLYTTPTDAANAFGWNRSTYSGHENGDRNPSRAAAKKYAKRYGVRWEWLLEGEGLPTVKPLVPIVGNVSAGAQIIFMTGTGSIGMVESPPSGNENTKALEVEGASMRGIADSGWLIYFDDERRPPNADLLGRICIVEIEGGQVLVRRLQPGRDDEHWDLELPPEPTIRDAKVIWAARVTWIKPR